MAELYHRSTIQPSTRINPLADLYIRMGLFDLFEFHSFFFELFCKAVWFWIITACFFFALSSQPLTTTPNRRRKSPNSISVVLLSPSSFVSHVNLDFAPFSPQIVWCAHFYCFSFRSVAAVFLPHSHSIWLLSFVMFCANVFVTHNTIHTHKISKNRFWRVSNFIFFTATHSRIISRV